MVFELRALNLESRHSHFSHTVHFALVIFGDGDLENYLPGLTLNCDPPDFSLPNR
jgi:hypothetical protein